MISVPSGRDADMLRGATWNMLRGRNVELAVRQLVEFVIREALDFACLQEVAPYAAAIDREARRRGWQLIYFADRPGAVDEAILVTNDVDATHPGTVQLSPFGWFGRTGAERPPLSMPHVLLDDWLRVGCIHQPPGTFWRDGVASGPGLRVAAVKSSARKLVRFAKWHPRRDLVLAGDWNESPHTEGRYSPRWIANEIDGLVKAPAVATHGAMPGRPPIDYVIARGCTVWIRGVRRVGGDHRAVLFDVRRVW